MDQKTMSTTKTKSTKKRIKLTDEEINLKKHKSYTLRVAKQLGYPKRYLERIEEATSEAEVDRLMVSARHSIQ